MIPLHCGFCGKGPFPTQAGLNKHISQTSSCHHASQKEFGNYLTNAWRERARIPGSLSQDEVSTPPSGDPSVDVEGTQMLEDDINPFGAENDVHTPATQAVERVHDAQAPPSDIVFVEPFPEEAKAGAIWGKARPNFQVFCDKGLGNTDWSPFEDEEEWVLAEWMIQNIGQKQTDTFLKLPIVSEYSFQG